MRRAFSQLRNGRLRPVVVEMPWDVLPEELPCELEYDPVPSTRTAPDPHSVREAAETLVAARRPVIYAGQGIHWAGAYDELVRLAELLAAPVGTSLAGKSAFDETHPLALGSGGAAVPGQLRHFLDRADVILGLGCSFSETAFGVRMPVGKHVIHATLDPADFNKTVSSQQVLAGDAGLTLAMLADACEQLLAEPRDLAPVAAEIAEVERQWMSEWLPLLTSEETPLNPYRVLWELQQVVDVAETIVTHDAGSPRDQLTPFWKTTAPLSYIGWGKSTQLGYGLGLAMGAKLACPDKLCINVWGDAAIGFTGMDFETAVRERLPILSILLNNSAMAIELPVMPVATERFRATDISGDYAAFARALGGYGERVEQPEDIAPAIWRGIAATRAGQPALLEFMTARETRASRL
jgi:acetolactate synthase-1/2/3 large subunit